MSRMTSTAYEFGRRTNVCALTGRVLVAGEPFIGALIEKPVEEGEGFERRDYAPEAWESSPRPERLFAFWRGRVGESSGPKHRLIDDESLLAMFEQLGDAVEPKQVAFRFVLALILVRKRLLVAAGSKVRKSDGASVMLVREKVTGPGSQARQLEMPLIEVVDPALDEATVLGVTEQLESVLKVDA